MARNHNKQLSLGFLQEAGEQERKVWKARQTEIEEDSVTLLISLLCVRTNSKFNECPYINEIYVFIMSSDKQSKKKTAATTTAKKYE